MKVTACSHIDLIVLEVLFPVVGQFFFTGGGSIRELLFRLLRDFSVDLLLTSSRVFSNCNLLLNEWDGVRTSYSVPSSGNGLYTKIASKISIYSERHKAPTTIYSYHFNFITSKQFSTWFFVFIARKIPRSSSSQHLQECAGFQILT